MAFLCAHDVSVRSGQNGVLYEVINLSLLLHAIFWSSLKRMSPISESSGDKATWKIEGMWSQGTCLQVLPLLFLSCLPTRACFLTCKVGITTTLELTDVL